MESLDMSFIDSELNKYRMMVGLEYNAQGQQGSVDMEPSNPFGDEVENVVKESDLQSAETAGMNWLEENNENYGVTLQRPTQFANQEQRVKDFERMLEEDEFYSSKRARVEDVLKKLTDAINNPNSPVNKEIAAEMFVKIMRDEFNFTDD